MVRLKKIALLTIMIPAVLLPFYTPAAAATPFRNIIAASALLAEADTGEALYEYKTGDRRPADSLTKIMTLLIAISACETGKVRQNDMIEMSDTAWLDMTSLSTTQSIMPGEKMTLLDLMYCAYVGSANEACNRIAEHVAGSIEAFIGMMNARAKELGCENTNYRNTHGQYNERQYTTAQDQFIVFREAMSHPLFVEMSSSYSYETASTNVSEPRRLSGTNSLLNANSKYYYRPCTSGIASASFEGGYSFVAFAETDGLSLITVVLGSDLVTFEDESTEMRNITETRRLFEWGFSEFSWRNILSTSYLAGKAPVTHGAGADYVNLRPELPIRVLLDNSIPDEEFIKTATIFSEDTGKTLYAPISAGEVLGEVTVTRKGVNYGTRKLIADTDIELHRLQFIKMQIEDLVTSTTARRVAAALLILIAGYIALVIRYNVKRRKRLRRIADAKKNLINERRSQHMDEE